MSGTENVYIPGDRYVKCDVCGFTYRLSEMRKGVSFNQKGYDVCPVDFDNVHPRETPAKLRKGQPLRYPK